MKIRRKHTPTGISNLNYDVLKNESIVTDGYRCKIQVKFGIWITVKKYWLSVIVERGKVNYF